MIAAKVISASLSPNAERDDVARAFGMLWRPWEWQHGKYLSYVADWFQKRLGISNIHFFDSGRSALLGILKAFGIGRGDEVIVQAFTCVAVPNSVLWASATPVYADVDGTYNLTGASVEARITKRTKAVIVQHTFGICADMAGILAVAKKHNLLVIEDCAHALGAQVGGKHAGTLGDAAFFSFGRDKAVSSVWGGAAVIQNRHKDANLSLKKYAKTLPDKPLFWVFQQLLHPIAFSVILPLYTIGIGKALLVILQRARLLSIPVYPEEKKGKKPAGFPSRYPNALAFLLFGQLHKLDAFVSRRRNAAKEYRTALADTVGWVLPAARDGSSYLRMPVGVPDPDRLLASGKRRGMLLGNWYRNVIDPAGTDFAAVGYVTGSCPVAEQLSRNVINLPTAVSEREIKQIIAFCRNI